MKNARIDAEVCVVGGGPAGAALACRLATLGHRVVLVERHPFPRRHVGESLSPGIWPLLELLGARATVEAAAFPRAWPARVSWGGPEALRSTPPPAGAGITVDRGRFDELLLTCARAAGAVILQPATARRPKAAGDGWEVPVVMPDRMLTVRARFLADASGRRRLLGGHREPTSPRTIAFHAEWSGVAADAAQTYVEARPDHWLWAARLPSGSVRAMAFLDPERVRGHSTRGLHDLFSELLAGSRLSQHLGGRWSQPATGISACDATSYASEKPIDKTSIRVGEACFAIDPLSSSGVQTAIQTAISATAAIGTVLAGDGDSEAAMQYYRQHQQDAVHSHARLAARSYRECAAYRGEPFWQRRARHPVESPEPSLEGHPALRLEELLAHPVRLREGARLLSTPCVVGDRVEHHRALSHRSLPRPVAYLGNSEVAPLLDELTADRPLREVVHRWSASLTAETALSVATWLVGRGLLERADAGTRHVSRLSPGYRT